MQAERLFPVPDTGTRKNASLRRVPPQNQRDVQIMASEAKRDEAAHVLRSLANVFDVQPVRSNKELRKRIHEYFDYCTEQRVLPTVEGLALYCGYTRYTLHDWQTGKNKGFSDVEADFTTSNIVKKAVQTLAAFDASLAMSGAVNNVSYIWRSKNFYDMYDSITIKAEPSDTMRPAMTVEDIAKNLPDISDLETEDNYA